MSHTGSESDQPEIEPYAGPAGGWGSVRSVEGILAQEGRLISGNLALLKQNKPDGFACVSCAWAKPAEPHPFEYCENGEGHGLGTDGCAYHARVLCRAHAG